ncbi:hypothetical protein SASPL_133661 [Salvia splendens]|uniref:Small subunit ribosomal protein S6 n=1 Tax=Salvia splendens TaxID=180675 RepID=A0A8X8ZJB9_SALSN|nr:hypothetical protein SASPL_133661 [Salvia splendens]
MESRSAGARPPPSSFLAVGVGNRLRCSDDVDLAPAAPGIPQLLEEIAIELANFVVGSADAVAHLTAATKKENKPKKKRKDDSHSFASKPDEATGPYPEVVLLKQRSVEEDGRLMPEFADVEERELFEALNLLLESDTNVDQMRHYEVVYLIHEDYKDEVENVNTKVRDFLEEKKGKVWRFSDWGMRRLAYKIKKAKNAHYILMNFEVEVQWINEFKSMLDRDERVIRHLVMKRDEAETEDCPPPPEFSTLRADMVDDDTDEEEEEDEEYDDEEDDQVYIWHYCIGVVENDVGDVAPLSKQLSLPPYTAQASPPSVDPIICLCLTLDLATIYFSGCRL